VEDEFKAFKGVREMLFDGVKPPSLKWIYDRHPDIADIVLPKRYMNNETGFSLFQLNKDKKEQPWLRITAFKVKLTQSFRYFEMSTAAGDVDFAWQITKFGKTMQDLSPDLQKQRWWRRNGGYGKSDTCNKLQGSTNFVYK